MSSNKDYTLSLTLTEAKTGIGARNGVLATAYTATIDRIDECGWYEALELFDDANIYQTWAYGSVIVGAKNVSRLVLRRDGEIAAMAQVRLARLPMTNIGIAYVLWGPVWRRRGREKDVESFRQAIRALREEYVAKRGLCLRVSLQIVSDGEDPFPSILAEEGLAASGRSGSRTILMDLRPSLETLREGMRAHWKRELKIGEKNRLDIEEGTGEELFAQFIEIYREMVARKRFAEPNDIDQFRAIQKLLPEALKMRILVGKSGGNVCAGAVCNVMGNTGLYLFGATSNAGLKSRGSYVLQWKFVEALKRDGVTVYDLNGINPGTNPGTFKFKSDLAGDHGADVYFLGTFDAQGGVLSRACLRVWNMLKARRRRVKK